MKTHTVWLLDVDGVINANRAGWGRAGQSAHAHANGLSYRLRWEPKVIDAVRTFHAAPGCVVRWATTWCDHEPELRRVLGLTLPVAFGARPAHLTYDEQKIDAARAVLDAGQRLVWTDDSVVPAAYDAFPRFRFAEARGDALLIAPKPSRGLRPDDIDRITAFTATAPSATTA